MNTETALQRALDLLGPWSKGAESPESNRLDIVLASTDLPAAVRALQEAGWGYLAAITGLDLGPEADELEVLYHFCAGGAVVTLRLRTPRSEAAVPSICHVIPSASFFERELSEMLGVLVSDTPDSSRLFLPDDWPEGVYPLRKDFSLDGRRTTGDG